MKKKLSILLVITLTVFVITGGIAVAQTTDDGSSEVITAEDGTAEDGELSESFEDISSYLDFLESETDLNSLDKIVLEKKLADYNVDDEESGLEIDTIIGVIDRYISNEIDLGQSFFILNNLNEAVLNGFNETNMMETLNNFQSDEKSGQLFFQTALEMRKLSKVYEDTEFGEKFSNEILSIIEENGDLEISDLKKLSSAYRKEAREKEREEKKINNSHKFENNSKNDNNSPKINNGNRGNSKDKKDRDNGKDRSKANKSSGKAKGKNK